MTITFFSHEAQAFSSTVFRRDSAARSVGSQGRLMHRSRWQMVQVPRHPTPQRFTSGARECQSTLGEQRSSEAVQAKQTGSIAGIENKSRRRDGVEAIPSETQREGRRKGVDLNSAREEQVVGIRPANVV